MNVDLLILGICNITKLTYLHKALTNLDKSEFKFNKKILAIDEFDGLTFPDVFKMQYTKTGWSILIDQHKSRNKSMIHGLEEAESEWVFYSEDDIIIDFPKTLNLDYFMKESDGRMPGIISFSFGGTAVDLASNDVKDMAFAEENEIHSTDEYFAYRRIESMRDKYFFEFPAVFVRKDLFLQCLSYASEKYRNHQIEQALSLAWFELDFYKKFYKTTILKREFLNYRKDSALKIMNCRYFSALDPNQGQFIHGGNTNIT